MIRKRNNIWVIGKASPNYKLLVCFQAQKDFFDVRLLPDVYFFRIRIRPVVCNQKFRLEM